MGKPRTIKGRAREVARRLAEEYPAECALVHSSAFQLVIATVLSAQSTDGRVNMVTPEVFRRWPTPADLAKADPEELESVIFPTGFYRNKAKSLIGLGQALDDRFGGEVPTALEDLVTLPGVGRKTGNVVRSVAFGLPPPKDWSGFSLRLILHGRQVCVARRPRCADCLLNDICPSSRVPA